MSKKKQATRTIGVFFGSRSPEHDVSIITGVFIVNGLKKLGYSVMPIYLSKDGAWYIGEELDSLKFFEGEFLRDKLSKLGTCSLDMQKSKGKMVLTQSKTFGKKEVIIDLAFPAIHGPHGEDGTLQGLFELLGVPYVGCDVATSAVAMDKVLTKDQLTQHNIPTPDYLFFSTSDWRSHKKVLENEVEKLKYPVFVKPASGGSSIAITKAKDAKELEQAVDVALHYDEKVLVEKAVENLADLTVAVLGNTGGLQEPQVSLIQEALFTDDLFSYEDKYIKEGGAQLGNAKNEIVIPADIPARIASKVQALALDVFLALECTGTARVDFLFNRETKDIFISEVNPLPGTLYHHLWEKSGLQFPALLKELIRLADERFQAKQRITSTFQSNLLHMANSQKLGGKIGK